MTIKYLGKPLDQLDDETLLRARGKVIAKSAAFVESLTMGAGILQAIDAELERRGVGPELAERSSLAMVN